MEVKILSYKLLAYSVFIAVVILLLKLFAEVSLNRLKITVCNEQDTMDIHLRYRGKDFLLNPRSVKNANYCVGKSIAFFDRTIDYLVNPSGTFREEIDSRYKNAQIITDDTIQIGEYNIRLNSGNITVSRNNQVVIIYRRPLRAELQLNSKGTATVPTVIRPPSSDTLEQLLGNAGLVQYVVPNGKYKVYKY